MKIAIFETKGWEEDYLKENLKNHKLIFFSGELNSKNIEKAKDADAVVIFIYSEIGKEVLDKLPKLKFIATKSTGFDHINIEECKRRGIKVCNVPYYGENTVAEHTFALILSLSRKICPSVERTKRDDFSIKDLMGFDLKGKTLGVIGPGHIGQRVIKMAHGFEMNVIAYSPEKDLKLAKMLKFKFVSLDELLKKSDVITLHAPLNEHTKHMINLRNVKLIKKGAYLVNTARGGLIDTSALVYALDKKILSGAALDVLEGEEDIKEEIQILRRETIKREEIETFIENHLLLKERNVIVTPHTAFFTKEALIRILDTTIGNLNGFLKNKKENRIC